MSLPVDIGTLHLEHPVLNGSGTFDAIAARRAFGETVWERFPFSAFVSKTITPEPRSGNPPPRLSETPAGLINSIAPRRRGLPSSSAIWTSMTSMSEKSTGREIAGRGGAQKR